MAGSLLLVVLAVVVGVTLVVVSALASWPTWRRVTIAVLGVVVAAAPVLVIVGFLTGQPEPLETDETMAIGVRVDDGAASVWLGSDCTDVTELSVVLKRDGSPSNDILELRSREPVDVTEPFGLTGDALPAGLQAEEPLQDEQLDLSQHYSLSVVEERSSTVLLEPVVAGSDANPGDFWFGDTHGWLSLAEAERKMADEGLSTVCAPAPEGTFGG